MKRFSLVLTSEQIKDADALAAKLSEKRGGTWSRADVMREALRRFVRLTKTAKTPRRWYSEPGPGGLLHVTELDEAALSAERRPPSLTTRR